MTGSDLTPERCREILLTIDGLGKNQKELALREYVAKLQRQKFLLELRLEQYCDVVPRQAVEILKEKIKQSGQKNDALNTENQKLKNRISDLMNKVDATEKKTKGPAFTSSNKHTDFIPKEIPADYIKIFWDGGTSSNTPPFGNGYGSYRVDNGVEGEIIRENFESRMSANVAEIKTAICALKHAQNTIHGDYKLWLVGDSQIALKWIETAYKRKEAKISNKSTQLFRDTIKELREAFESNLRIIDLVAEWRPRRYSVEIFGH